MDAVLEKVRKYCAYQERCRKEVLMKLASLGIPKEKAGEIVNQLIEEGFINEERFVESYIRGKMNTKGWGIQKLTYNLKMKGVDEQLIKKHLQAVDPATVEENLISLIEKWMRGKELNYTTKPKLYRYLMSRGYSSGEISRALTQININFNENDNF